MSFFYLLFLGAFTGILAGYLGIGGGVVLVPVLTELFLARGMDIDHTMTSAFATSLLTAVFTTGASAYRQIRQDNLIRNIIPWTAAGAILGSQFGAYLGSKLKGGVLLLFFAIFLFFAAINLAIGKPKGRKSLEPRYSIAGFFALGIATGIAGALFGVGGGILMVPAFILIFNLPPGRCAGTSSAVAFLLAISAVIGYLFYGSSRATGAEGFIGVIDFSVAIPIAIGTVATAQFGAMLNKKYGGAVYQRVFAVFLVFVAVRMFIRGL